MPNVLIQPYSEGVQAAASIPIFDPRFERESRTRFHRESIPELSRANALYVANGKWPARAWVLCKRSDYNLINTYATNLSLQFHDVQTGTQQTFGPLTVVQARCVSRGIEADPAAIYLVELTDMRGLVYTHWFQWPTTSWYNVRAPAYPGQYYTTSLNGGSPWTWDQMLGDLWGQLTPMGTYPGLPITPTSPCEGFSFRGVSCWEAICGILDLLGCTVGVDLTKTSPYTIVSLGLADAIHAALDVKYLSYLEDDLEYIDTGSGRVPGQVTMLFHRRNQYYGTEETVRLDAFQWASTPYYSVTVNAPSAFSSAVGHHYIWSDFTVQFDVDGNPLAADVTTANAVATEQVTEYYNRLSAGTNGYMRQTYRGVLPYFTGSRVDGVCWHQDYRDEMRLGWRTDLIRGPQMAWPEVAVNVAL